MSITDKNVFLNPEIIEPKACSATVKELTPAQLNNRILFISSDFTSILSNPIPYLDTTFNFGTDFFYKFISNNVITTNNTIV